jgi:hypothetical protein
MCVQRGERPAQEQQQQAASAHTTATLAASQHQLTACGGQTAPAGPTHPAGWPALCRAAATSSF